MEKTGKQEARPFIIADSSPRCLCACVGGDYISMPTHKALLGEADWPHQHDTARQGGTRCSGTESHLFPAWQHQGPDPLFVSLFS